MKIILWAARTYGQGPIWRQGQIRMLYVTPTGLGILTLDQLQICRSYGAKVINFALASSQSSVVSSPRARRSAVSRNMSACHAGDSILPLRGSDRPTSFPSASIFPTEASVGFRAQSCPKDEIPAKKRQTFFARPRTHPIPHASSIKHHDKIFFDGRTIVLCCGRAWKPRQGI
jgi:hypothetical protein